MAVPAAGKESHARALLSDLATEDMAGDAAVYLSSQQWGALGDERQCRLLPECRSCCKVFHEAAGAKVLAWGMQVRGERR